MSHLIETAAAPPPSPSISELAATAIAQLDALEASLGLNIVLRPNDKNQIRALSRVTDAALGLASNIVQRSPASFPAFAGLPVAAEYVKAMTTVAARALTLATHLQNSVKNQRAPAALQTLALYGVAKHLGRISENETMRESVARLQAEIAPKRTKPKQTKAEKALKDATRSRNQRITKAAAYLRENGIQVPEPQAAAAAPAALPTSEGVALPSPAPAAT